MKIFVERNLAQPTLLRFGARKWCKPGFARSACSRITSTFLTTSTWCICNVSIQGVLNFDPCVMLCAYGERCSCAKNLKEAFCDFIFLSKVAVCMRRIANFCTLEELDPQAHESDEKTTKTGLPLFQSGTAVYSSMMCRNLYLSSCATSIISRACK